MTDPAKRERAALDVVVATLLGLFLAAGCGVGAPANVSIPQPPYSQAQLDACEADYDLIRDEAVEGRFSTIVHDLPSTREKSRAALDRLIAVSREVRSSGSGLLEPVLTSFIEELEALRSETAVPLLRDRANEIADYLFNLQSGFEINAWTVDLTYVGQRCTEIYDWIHENVPE